MGYHLRGPEQVVPEAIRGWADPGIWKLVAFVETIDMSGFLADYCADGWGGQPYDPRLMLVSVWWCYRHGVRSPEGMARACQDSASLRVVWARDQVPCAATFRRFIAGHPQGWRLVQASTVARCVGAGLADMSVTATDSTPMDAPAALPTAQSAARLTVLIDQAEQALAAVRQQAVEAADQGLVDQSCHTLRRREQRLLTRLGKLRAAEAAARQRDEEVDDDHPPPENTWAQRAAEHRQELDDLIAQKQEACDVYQAKVAAGCKPRGPAPRAPLDHPRIRAKIEALARCEQRLAEAAAKPVRRRHAARVAPSDPTSRILKGKNTTTWVLGRLFTITVYLGQIILVGVLSPEGNDARGLHPTLAAAADIRDLAGITQPTRYDLADSGFASEAVFTTPSALGGRLLISVTNENDQLHGTTPTTTLTARQDMATRLATEEGKTTYRLRSPMVEPVFAHILRTDRHLHLRGPAQHNEIIAITSAYNAEKYLRYQYSRTRPQHLTRKRP
jgi:transposase